MIIIVKLEIDEDDTLSPEDTHDELISLLAGTDYDVVSVRFPE